MRSSTRSLLSKVKESAQVLKFRSENKKGAAITNMKLEVVIVPVSDVDRAKAFYEKLGFRLDIDVVNENFRGIQFTPPRSETSIIFGTGVTSARSGSADLVLAVDNRHRPRGPDRPRRQRQRSLPLCRRPFQQCRGEPAR